MLRWKAEAEDSAHKPCALTYAMANNKDADKHPSLSLTHSMHVPAPTPINMGTYMHTHHTCDDD